MPTQNAENKHGTEQMYRSGCKCDECLSFVSKRNSIYAYARRVVVRDFKKKYPEQWERILEEAYDHYGVERPKRIKTEDYWWNYNDL